MENFDFIESGIVFGLDTAKAMKEFRHPPKDFAVHGDAYKFVVNFFDEYGEIPSADVLQENFPTLDTSAQTINIDYAVDAFKNQVLYRDIINVFQSQKTLLQEDPKSAFSKLTSGLNDIGIAYDEDVVAYNDDSISRLEEWRARYKARSVGNKMLGISTPLHTINNTGVGWLPGEMISMYARPTIGKTWFCVYTAATAVMQGAKTLLVSTEMPISSIALRADVIFAKMLGYNISHRALRSGDVIDEDEYSKFLDDINEQQLFICDRIAGQNSITIDSIAALVRKHSPEFVVLDGAYLVNSGTGRKAAWEESHALFYGLKNLCTAMNISMLVSTQATKDASDIFRPPQADQVAFGDALLRASDVVLSMCLVEDNPERRLIQYQKYRDAESFADTSLLHWNPDVGEIHEVNPDF